MENFTLDMKIKIISYNKDTDNFDSYYIDFDWLQLKNKSVIEVLQANRYLYYRKIKDFYKNNNIPYKDYLYDTFYEEQFNNIIP